MGKIEIFKGRNKQFYFRAVAKNGKIVAQSEGYKSKAMCKRGIVSLRRICTGYTKITEE